MCSNPLSCVFIHMLSASLNLSARSAGRLKEGYQKFSAISLFLRMTTTLSMTPHYAVLSFIHSNLGKVPCKHKYHLQPNKSVYSRALPWVVTAAVCCCFLSAAVVKPEG